METGVTGIPPWCVVDMAAGRVIGTTPTIVGRPPVARDAPIVQCATLSQLRTQSTGRLPVTAVGIAWIMREKDFGRIPGTVDEPTDAGLARTHVGSGTTPFSVVVASLLGQLSTRHFELSNGVLTVLSRTLVMRQAVLHTATRRPGVSSPSS